MDVSDEFERVVIDVRSECNGDVAVAIDRFHYHGLSKLESIVAVSKLFGLELTEAKLLVHRHEVWSAVRKRDEDNEIALISLASRRS